MRTKSGLISLISVTLMLSLVGGSAAMAAKPENTGKPETTGKPVEVGKPVEIGGTGVQTKEFVNARPDDAGKPAVSESAASFGATKRLSAAEIKAAKLEKAAEKKANGGKLPYIVRFNEAATLATEIAELKNLKATVGKSVTKVFQGVVVEMTDGQKAAFAKRSTVASITEDVEVTATDIQVSPASWGIDRIDQTALPLSSSYNYGGSGAGVDIYVVDTGIKSAHSEFTGRISAGYSSVSDANGTEDCNGHGTHVASTAAGTQYGVAKSATVIPVRVLGCDGSGSISGVIYGLDWIAKNYVAGDEAVVNMSLGGGANSSLDAAVNSLINRGITVVVAAGNSAADACTASPARVIGEITVGATTRTDGYATYSNFGSCVDLAAPGSSITGAWIGSNTDSATLNGTSMASPHVAGAAAVLLGSGYQAPNMVQLAIKDAASTIPAAPAGTTNRLLYLNPAGISTPVELAPLAPTSVSAVAVKRTVTVDWTPADNTGRNVLSQTVKIWSAGNVVSTVRVSATATTVKVNLRPNERYWFTVVASNATATSVDSPVSNTVIPRSK